MKVSLPSYQYLIITTLLSSILSCWGLVYEDSISLLSGAIIIPTSNFLYESIRFYVLNRKISIYYIIFSSLITIIIPLLIGYLFGIFFYLVDKSNYHIFKDSSYNIPNKTMNNMIKPDFLNMLFLSIMPFFIAMFIPYSIKKNNIILQFAIVIALSFVSPLTTIGLFIGSNHYTNKLNDINLFYVPMTKFISNLCAIVLSALLSFKI